MLYMFFLFIFTLFMVWLVEKFTFKVSKRIFRKQLEEIEKKEKKIEEYQQLSLLAMLSKEKDAVYGFQDMANELYWQIFFQKLVMFSSLFFLILSPYMILVHYLLKNTIPYPFGVVFSIAILYFMCKTVYMYVKSLLIMRREFKEHREKL